MEQLRGPVSLYVVSAPDDGKEDSSMRPVQVHATIEEAVYGRSKKGQSAYPIYVVQVLREIPQSELFKYEDFRS